MSKKYSICISILIVYILCRLFVFDIYYISGSSMEDTLFKGDVVLVNKISYGGRFPTSILDIPMLKIFIYPFLSEERIYKEKSKLPSKKRFFGSCKIKRGDVIVLNDPCNYQSYLIKRCVALSKDTISIEKSDLIINSNRIDEYP